MNSLYRAKRSALALVLFVALTASPITIVAAKAARKPRRNAAKARPAHLKKGRAEAKHLAALRRAEAARLAAAARERAAEDQMRQRVQDLIAKDDVRGEDPEIRRIAVDALGDHAGTVVVMDPRTGRIYTIVNQQWAARETFKPCSTIKLVTSVAGVSEEVIDPSNTAAISDSNRVTADASSGSLEEPLLPTGRRSGWPGENDFLRSPAWFGRKDRHQFPQRICRSASGFAHGRRHKPHLLAWRW